MGRIVSMKLPGVLLPGILLCALHGQAPSDLFDRAPPQVDEALRERIAVFYQAHVDEKFRLADTVVHEDSKDAFFVAEKKKHNGFKIVRINYSDSFTRATVVVAVDTDFVMLGFGTREVTIPLTTRWKLEDGEWWWCVEPNPQGVESPFGLLKPGADPKKAAASARLANLPTAAKIRGQVKVSKTEVRLSSTEASSDEVIVVNGMPGPITLTLTTGAFPGFEAKLDRTELQGGDKAKIVFRCDPVDTTPKPELRALLKVFPTNYVIQIRITFAPPPELEKQIPAQRRSRSLAAPSVTEKQRRKR